MSDLDRILKKLNDFRVDTERAVDDTVLITANRVKNTALKDIRNPSVGRKYPRGKEGKYHIASKPGYAPNNDTNVLSESIKVSHARGTMTAKIGTNKDYGAILEIEMNRPWLEPAVGPHVANYHTQLEKVIDEQIRKADR